MKFERDELQKHDVKGKEPDTKEYLLNNSMYVGFKYGENKSMLLEITTAISGN